LELALVAEVQLGEVRDADTRFPFILFLSQAETEDLLEGLPHLHEGPRAGDRLGDARLTMNGATVSLQRTVVGRI